MWKLEENHPKLHHLLLSEKWQWELFFLFLSEDGVVVGDGDLALVVRLVHMVPFQSMKIHWCELSNSSLISKIFYITYLFYKKKEKTNSHETFAIAMVQMMQASRFVNDIFWAIIAVTWGEQNEWSAAARVPFDFFLAYLLSFVWARF